MANRDSDFEGPNGTGRLFTGGKYRKVHKVTDGIQRESDGTESWWNGMHGKWVRETPKEKARREGKGRRDSGESTSLGADFSRTFSSSMKGPLSEGEKFAIGCVVAALIPLAIILMVGMVLFSILSGVEAAILSVTRAFLFLGSPLVWPLIIITAVACALLRKKINAKGGPRVRSLLVLVPLMLIALVSSFLIYNELTSWIMIVNIPLVPILFLSGLWRSVYRRAYLQAMLAAFLLLGSLIPYFKMDFAEAFSGNEWWYDNIAVSAAVIALYVSLQVGTGGQLLRNIVRPARA